MKSSQNCLTVSLCGVLGSSLLIGATGFPHLPVQGDSIEPPPGQGAPAGTWGGGSRIGTACQARPDQPSPSPIALSPNRYIGQTSTPRPTFLIYLPTTAAESLEFSLFDHTMRGIAQTIVPSPKQYGLLELPLPPHIADLQLNQTYYWTVALICNPGDRTEDLVSRGRVRYTPLTPGLHHQLQAASPLKQVQLLYDSGFWYEALHLLLQQQQRQQLPHTALQKMWSQFLQPEGISTIRVNTLVPLYISTYK